MTNKEKYKTAQERAEAFREWCHETVAQGKCNQSICTVCQFEWLELEAPVDKPLPCPFCGGNVQIINDTQAIAENAKWLINCYGCQYEYGAETKEKLIAAHNRVARAVKGEVAK